MTKKETIARAIGKYLENQGWNVFEISEKCRNCGRGNNPYDAKFCAGCGTILKQDPDQGAIDDLHEAFKAGKKAELKWHKEREKTKISKI